MEMDRSFSPAFELADELKLIWSVKQETVSFSEPPISLHTHAVSQIFVKRRELRWKKLKNATRTVLKYCPMPVPIMNFVICTVRA